MISAIRARLMDLDGRRTGGRGRPADPVVGRNLPAPVVVIVVAFLAGAVLAAVHHAEVVAHKVGEPFGSVVLAVAVTVIEVALVVTLMISGGEKTQTLARDTVFAAVMITCNGILGLSLLIGALRRRVALFNPEGTGAALATVGLTIPAIAIASIWLDGPLWLRLGGTQMILLALTVVVGVLTVVPGRATLLQAGVHLSLLAPFLFLAASP